MMEQSFKTWKKQQLEEKLKEFDQWRKEEVFDEVNDLGQT